MEGYCYRCGAKREIAEPQKALINDGNVVSTGQCPVCHSQMMILLDILEGYCAKCRTMREVGKLKPILMKDDSSGVSGECKTCGSQIVQHGIQIN